MANVTIGQVAEAIGAPGAAEDWAEHLQLWESIYACERKELTLDLIDGTHTRDRRSLGMGKRIPEDWAGLLWTENAVVEVAGNPETALFDSVFDDSFAPEFADALERAMAAGTGAVEVLVEGLQVSMTGEVTPSTETGMAFDYVPASRIIPLKWVRGRITEIAFVSFIAEDRVTVREHRDTSDGRIIINSAWVLKGDDLVAEVLPEDVAPILTLPGFPRMFAVLKPALSNNLDATSPFGIPVYANAVDQLDALDDIFDNFCEDIHLGGKMVFLPESMLQRSLPTENYPKGRPIPPQKNKTNLFVAVEEGMGDGEKITEHNPDLRVSDNTAAIDAALGFVGMACGMGQGRYRYREGGVQTATQVVSESSDLFRARRKHMLMVAAAIEDIGRAVLAVGATFMGLPVKPDAEITVRSDDSVIEDDGARIARGLLLFQSGAISQRRFLIDYMLMTEEDADAEVANAPTAAPLF